MSMFLLIAAYILVIAGLIAMETWRDDNGR